MLDGDFGGMVSKLIQYQSISWFILPPIMVTPLDLFKKLMFIGFDLHAVSDPFQDLKCHLIKAANRSTAAWDAVHFLSRKLGCLHAEFVAGMLKFACSPGITDLTKQPRVTECVLGNPLALNGRTACQS